MRLLFLPLGLVLGLANPTEAAAGSGGSQQEVPGAGADTASSPAKTKRKRRARVPWKRRAGKPAGYAVPEAMLRRDLPPPPSGNIHLVSLASKESLKINIFNEDGSYNVDVVKSVSHLLRCKRTEDERDIEPRLMTVLSHVYDKYGKPLELLSGYRNQQKTSSYHYKGSAADIRVEGVPMNKLRAFVESLDAGGMGVGVYPKVGFVHVDVRPPPSYRWIDNSRSNPNSPDKRPPRSWRQKRREKLQS
jgi:uncharacterized protein YcbK (DUF882 family)